MASHIRIEVDDRQVLDALEQLRARAADLKPALNEIGEHLAETTKRRFDTSTAPDGSRWAPNSQVTFLQYLSHFKGSYTKSGKLSSKGAGRVVGKKPLIGETRSLSSEIYPRLTGDGVEIGSPMEYAAVQQFGAKQGAFGRDRRNHPIPWGDIPARPFLGLSSDDRDSILDIVRSYLAG